MSAAIARRAVVVEGDSHKAGVPVRKFKVERGRGGPVLVSHRQTLVLKVGHSTSQEGPGELKRRWR